MVTIQQGLREDGFEVSMVKLCRWFRRGLCLSDLTCAETAGSLHLTNAANSRRKRSGAKRSALARQASGVITWPSRSKRSLTTCSQQKCSSRTSGRFLRHSQPQ